MIDSSLPDDMENAVVLPIEDWIDLHSFRPAEVASVVEEYLDQACQKGFVQVRIIHGRGIGVQREIVQALLRCHPRVHSYSDTPDHGATIVALLRGGH